MQLGRHTGPIQRGSEGAQGRGPREGRRISLEGLPYSPVRDESADAFRRRVADGARGQASLAIGFRCLCIRSTDGRSETASDEGDLQGVELYPRRSGNESSRTLE